MCTQADMAGLPPALALRRWLSCSQHQGLLTLMVCPLPPQARIRSHASWQTDTQERMRKTFYAEPGERHAMQCVFGLYRATSRACSRWLEPVVALAGIADLVD